MISKNEASTMKVLLINPPTPDLAVWVREGRCQQWDIWGAPFAPFSLAMVSTQLTRAGHDCRILDCGPAGLDINAVLKEAEKFMPAIAILSTASPTIESDLAWFTPQLKNILPACQIAALGIHPSSLPEKTLERYAHLDFIFLGEPELPAVALVTAIANGSNFFREIPNLAYKNKNGEIYVNERVEYPTNLDALGFPDWDKIDFNNYKMPIVKRPFSLISFSRGCPYKCKYCAAGSYNGKKLRKRSIPSLIEEIKFNLDHNVSDFLFWTELMTLDDTYLNEFLETIFKEKLDRRIHWVCNSRVDSVRDNTLRKMHRAGCWQIAFGLEFGSDEILKLSGKGGSATLDKGREAVHMASNAGLVVDGHFMMGYPGETEKHLQATIDFACSLPLTFAHFYAATPFPGSELYTSAIENAWCSPDAWESYNQDDASLTTPWLSPKITNSYICKAYKKFYLRPSIFARILKIPKSLYEYIEIMKMGVAFMHNFTKSL